MKISYKWLKEYVDFTLSVEEVCKALTSTGLEVGGMEEVESIRGGLRGLYIGKVLTCDAHPNSDHLHVCSVDLGREVPSQIVCGAPNVAAGQHVVVADLGCTLYHGDEAWTIKKSKLRGVESGGMICAEDEIGVGTSHDGIIVLPDTAPVGQSAAEYYSVESDWLIEIDITANRADALSHWGVARDLYAWLKANGYDTTLHRPTCDDFHVADNSLPVKVTIENSEACRRYACVSITGCEVKESPEWLKNKLQIIGLRPINNIVDITNYVMMAYGQPLHCFDADMVTGHHIIVKDKNEGRPFVTLDGEEHTLGAHDLAICNEQEPMCIAGVFGGKGSGTYETTRNVVLESAYFHPTWIRKSARRHGLSTDASFRFERGVDPNGIIYALKQAAILCCQLAGGKVSMEICDEYPNPIADPVVTLEYQYVDRLIGKHLPADTIKSIVTSLDMAIEGEDEGKSLTLRIPAYRVDVIRPCDVVEDILRIYGYNNVEIPTQLKNSLVTQGIDDRKHQWENIIGEQLVGAGFNEILNNSLTRRAYYADLQSCPPELLVGIMNPLSSDLNVMRQTLLFGGLETIAYNVNRKQTQLHLFEMGNIYRHHPDRADADNPMRAYQEEKHLALWISGQRVSGSWAHPNEDTSVYELKAYVINILRRTGIKADAIVEKTMESDLFAQALSIELRNGKALCQMGVVHPKQLKKTGVTQAVYYADICWDTLMKQANRNKVEFAELSKYPAVSRDLALLLDNDVAFADVERVARQAERKLLRRVELFDVYEGKNLPEGKKSYAVNFILQDEQRTLNDKQIDTSMQRIIAAVKKELNAELR